MTRRFSTAQFLTLSAQLALWNAACDDGGKPEDDAEARADFGVNVELHAPTNSLPQLSGAQPQRRTELMIAKPVMPSAQASFQEVMALIAEHYVDGPLDGDLLWTAATEGVLARLIQVRGAHVNALLSPAELQALRSGIQGQVQGIGVNIELVAEVAVVREVISEGPAALAGVLRGDRILAVDGQQVHGLSLLELVEKIRGEQGSSVELLMQRDTEEWNLALTRSPIAYSSVESTLISPTVGYLRINNFSAATAGDLEQALTRLTQGGAESLVLDLRNCPGGLLDASIAVADLFLAKGLTIVSLQGRGPADGPGNRSIDAEHTDDWESTPIAVLTGPETASGAEILAAALQHHRHAHVIGEQTMGKGTVEEIHQLENGWGLRLSVSRFTSAAGEAILGQGVRPDLSLPGPSTRVILEDVSIEDDAQLAAAVAMLHP